MENYEKIDSETIKVITTHEEQIKKAKLLKSKGDYLRNIATLQAEVDKIDNMLSVIEK